MVLDVLSKINPSSTASAAAAAAAAAAADPQSVPAAAPAPAAPAAPAPPLSSAGDAHAAPDRGPPGDDDPSSRDPAAAQEHTHQPPLQRGCGDARSRYVSPLLWSSSRRLWPDCLTWRSIRTLRAPSSFPTAQMHTGWRARPLPQLCVSCHVPQGC